MASSRRRTICYLSIAPLIWVGVGCQRGPTFVEVNGTVRLNGKPLAGVQVQFLPDPQRGTTGPRSTAVTDDNGSYSLASDDERPGAMVGIHRVLVSDLIDYGMPHVKRKEMDRIDPKLLQEKASKNRVPKRYADVLTTPWSIEVKPNASPIDLDLTSP
jgi:hypothetical protein